MATAKVSEQRRELSGEGTDRRAAITYRVSSPPDAPNLFLEDETVVLAQGGLPSLLAAHPALPDLRAVRRRTTRVRDSSGSAPVWDVTFEYEPVEIILPDSGIEAETESNVNLSFQAQFLDMYRVEGAGFNPNADGNGAGCPVFLRDQYDAFNKDVGGDPVDSRGEPLSVLNYTARLDIVQVTNRFQTLIDSTQLVGKRNDREFFGFQAQSLLYVGADVVGAIGEQRIRLTHHFAFDKLFHLRQIPFKLVDGRVQTAEDAATAGFGPSGYGGGTAWPIFWVQPYPDLDNFAKLRIFPEQNVGP